MPSVTNQPKVMEGSGASTLSRDYSILTPDELKNAGGIFGNTADRNDLELPVIGNFNNLETIDEELILENLKVQLLPFRYCAYCGIKNFNAAIS